MTKSERTAIKTAKPLAGTSSLADAYHLALDEHDANMTKWCRVAASATSTSTPAPSEAAHAVTHSTHQR